MLIALASTCFCCYNDTVMIFVAVLWKYNYSGFDQTVFMHEHTGFFRDYADNLVWTSPTVAVRRHLGVGEYPASVGRRQDLM